MLESKLGFKNVSKRAKTVSISGQMIVVHTVDSSDGVYYLTCCIRH